MKKNIFKKIVASLATVAMAVGMFAAMPAEEAKAADPVGVDQDHPISITFHFQKPEEWSKVYVKACIGDNWEYPKDDTAGNYTGYKGPDSETGLLEEDENNKGWYTVTVKTGNAWGINLIFAESWGEKQTKNIQIAYSMPAGEYEFWFTMADQAMLVDNCRLGLSEYKSLYGDAEKPYVEMDSLAKAPTGWVKSSDSAVAAKAEEAIDEAIAVAATKANKAKYDKASSAYNGLTDAQKALVDSAKVTKLNAGVKAINDILEAEQAAEDAKYAGTVTVYVKKPAAWDKVLLYAWDRVSKTVFGPFPGTELTALTQNKGWYSCSFPITKATSILFGNGNGNGANQSADWSNVKAGTYWMILDTQEGDGGKYKVDNVSTTAPSGWKDEKAQEVTTQAPTTTKPAVDKGSVASKADVEKIDKEAVVEGAPADAKLDATEIAADSDAFKVVKEAAKTAFKNKTYVALDLKLLKGTETVQANGDVKVTIPVPTALAKSTKVAVYRVGDDNKLVSCGTADVANGKITFTTNHFSTYVFADASVSTSKPGDAAPIVLMLAVAAVAAGMVVASKKKTICE